MIPMLLLISVALAWDSEPQPVTLADEVDVYHSAGFSTGYVPSGSPVQVQFAIESVGGARVSMDAETQLSWPDAVYFDLVPEPGTGELVLDASLDAVTSVAIDLSDWGYYGTFEIDRRSFGMDAWTDFEPLVLDGSVQDYVELVDPGDALQLIAYSFEIIAGLSLDFATELRAEARAGFGAVEVRADGEPMVMEGQHVPLDYAPTSDKVVEVVYSAQWDAGLDLVFTPALEACADLFGCVTVVEFDLPVALIDDSFVQDFPAVFPVFPLPLIEVGEFDADFGDVPVGTVATVDVPVTNLGSLLLEGTARTEGSADFSVFPTSFSATPGATDGVVVSFLPSGEGAQSATLVLESNDPGQPELRIDLVANGASLAGEDEGDDIEVVTKPLQGCGCASSPTGRSLPLGILAVALAWRRRRP